LQRGPHIACQAVLQKTEEIEQGCFPTAIGADENGVGGKGVEREILQCPEVPNGEAFDFLCRFPHDCAHFPDGLSGPPDDSVGRTDGLSRHTDGLSVFPEGSSSFPNGLSSSPDIFLIFPGFLSIPPDVSSGHPGWLSGPPDDCYGELLASEGQRNHGDR